MNIKAWLGAFRLRTLPLALSVISMGSVLAYGAGRFNTVIFGLSILTTILLQVLSNLANDYGDSIHGADSEERQGPSRAVQTGAISPQAMKTALIVFSILSFISGGSLILSAFSLEQLWYIIGFLVLGGLCIYAAITYTAGSNPYGYAGLGDLSVLMFFGYVGVLGGYYLHTQSFDWLNMLPATSCGFFAVGVLNVNNIRDIESDKKAGKNSIPVRIGRSAAVGYHWVLLLGGQGFMLIFNILNTAPITSYLFLLSLPLMIKNARAVTRKKNPKDLDPYLKQMALSTLAFVVLYTLGLILSTGA